MTTYQTQILAFIRKNGGITKKQATELIGHNCYTNAPKYVGLCLTRMVGAGMIKRTGRGVFKAVIKEGTLL